MFRERGGEKRREEEEEGKGGGDLGKGETARERTRGRRGGMGRRSGESMFPRLN